MTDAVKLLRAMAAAGFGYEDIEVAMRKAGHTFTSAVIRDYILGKRR